MITIGRDPACTIPLDAALAPVSRRHAQIERDGDDYILTDLGSENGLFVDGVRGGPLRQASLLVSNVTISV